MKPNFMQSDISSELSYAFLPTDKGPKTIDELSGYENGFDFQPPLTLRELEYEKVSHILSCTDINPLVLVDSPGGEFSVYNSLLAWAERTEPYICVVGEVTSAALLWVCFAHSASVELMPGVFGTLHSWTFGSDTRSLQTVNKDLKTHFDNFNKDIAEGLNLSQKYRNKFLKGEDIFLTTDLLQKLLNREL